MTLWAGGLTKNGADLTACGELVEPSNDFGDLELPENFADIDFGDLPLP